MRIMMGALALAALAGCASSGTKVDPETMATFRRGVTTAAQVQAALGPPNASATLPTGGLVMVYTYAHSQVRAATFIPYIGPFVGGSDTQTQSVSFTFGPDGLLSGNSSAQGQIGTGMGLTAH